MAGTEVGMLLWALQSSAEADETSCPWKRGEPLEVEATMTSVTIEGKLYSVLGTSTQGKLYDIFAACDMPTAAGALEQWRSYRQQTNVSVASLILFPVAAFTASEAGRARAAFEVEVEKGPPLPTYRPAGAAEAPAPERKSSGETCSVYSPESQNFAGRTKIEYESGALLHKEEMRRASIELRDPVPTPNNGKVILHIERPTIDLADGENVLVVIESGDAQVLRDTADHISAEVPIEDEMWWNIIGVPIPDAATFPIRFHAIDRILSVRCSWVIAADGTIEQVSR